jgi:hypothetical protein
LYGDFVWARRALKHQKRRFLARAVVQNGTTISVIPYQAAPVEEPLQPAGCPVIGCDGCFWQNTCRTLAEYPTTNQSFCYAAAGVWCANSLANSSSVGARIVPGASSAARNLSFVCCCEKREHNTDGKVVGIDASDTKSDDASTIDTRWRYPSIDRTYQNLNSWVLVVSLQCTDVTGVYISLHAAQMSCLKLLNCSGVSGSANYADGYFETCAGPVMLAAPIHSAENSHRIVLAPKAVLQLVGVNLGEDNLALGRPAQQSSQSQGGHASRAVDGGRTSDYNAGSCTHTDTAPSWWQVDLVESHVIAAVSVKLNEINLPP